jgi:transcriptional regulator with XRE-family HTH domain
LIEKLTAVETLRQQQGLSRHQLADRLGIPFETFRRWFHRISPKLPSPAHLRKLEFYVTRTEGEASEWGGVWEAIRSWWQTQHRYTSALDLAREIGWDGDHLDSCLRTGAPPPRLVVERLAGSLRIPTPASPPQVGEAERRTELLKALLTLLHEELAWFRDGPEEVRGVFRSGLDPFDVGYLSSLLAMLSDEGRFKRWLAATTNRFASFERKGGRP